jgi:hypothetical protein
MAATHRKPPLFSMCSRWLLYYKTPREGIVIPIVENDDYRNEEQDIASHHRELNKVSHVSSLKVVSAQYPMPKGMLSNGAGV